MKGYYLYEQIGDPILMCAPGVWATDVASSAANAGVPIRDADGVLLILAPGTMTTDSVTVYIEYSSTGTASDGGLDSDVWAASDCAFASVDSDGENEAYVMDINFSLKGLSDADGKIFAKVDDTAGGGGTLALIGIPYGVTKTPATNANTVIVPDYATV